VKDDVAAVREQLTDARALCAALGLVAGYKPGRVPRGLLIRCPVHNEQTPSCSVTAGPDGTIRVRCFGCDFTGDVLHLIAAAHNLDVRADFPAVLGEAARLAGVDLGREQRTNDTRPASYQAPTYPESDDVEALWSSAVAVGLDGEARTYLEGRAIDAGAVELYDLARVLPAGGWAPSWARCRGRSWSSSHRLILPVVDHTGAVRSLRAWRLPSDEAPEDAPKRTAPAGKALAGLVLACPVARRMLTTGALPSWGALDVVITEGEPDFLTWAARVSDANEAPPAVLGVVAGAWGAALAARIPDGARVIIRTHPDAAGDRYASAIRQSLTGRSVQKFTVRQGSDRGQAA
jgi:hypothetical protein